MKRVSKLDKEIGKRLKEERQRLGLSQTDLAKAIKVTFQQIQKYENGTNRIAAGNLYLLAKRLGTSIDVFFFNIETP